MTTRRFLAVAWASWVARWVVAGVAIALTETPASIRVARKCWLSEIWWFFSSSFPHSCFVPTLGYFTEQPDVRVGGEEVGIGGF